MPKPILSNTLHYFPTVFIALMAWLSVYKKMKAENISFKEYLIRRKNRVYMALFFMLISIGYGIYSITMIHY